MTLLCGCRADEAPSSQPMLYLNGERGNGLINNVCFPSNVASSYAPSGQVWLYHQQGLVLAEVSSSLGILTVAEQA